MIRICQLALIGALLVLASAHAILAGPLEDRLLADAADGRWDQHTLMRAALISSGIADQPTLARLERRYANIQKQLANQPWKNLPASHRAKQLLLWLHKHVLTGGYQKDSSSLAQALEGGQFNCVSSAILYHALAQEIGLETQLVAIPEHLYIELVASEKPGRIETTTPGGAFPATASGSLERTNRQGPRRVLSQVQAVALLHYNRGAACFREKDYASSVGSNLTAVRLNPHHAEARANLIASINNWAVLLSKQERYHQAGALLETGLALAPGEASLKANLRNLKQARRSQKSSSGGASFVSTETPSP